jgi:hypothetical protein
MKSLILISGLFAAAIGRGAFAVEPPASGAPDAEPTRLQEMQAFADDPSLERASDVDEAKSRPWLTIDSMSG